MPLQDWLLGQAVNTLLGWKSRPSAIRGALGKREYLSATDLTPDSVTVGIVQMQSELVDDGVQFADKYYTLVGKAVQQGAQLVVFPEYAWLPILGLLPPVRELARKGITLEGAVHELAPGGGLTVSGVMQTVAPAVKRVFETTASELAARFHVYLMPGTAITMDDGHSLFNTAYLYGPNGRLIGTQNKLHPTHLEEGWMTCGRELEVWTLPFGKVAAPVCMDFTYWETARAATMRGAEILLDMSADAMANHAYLAARGDESRIQESWAYSTRVYNVTRLFGFNFCGPSHIAAPIGLGASTYLAKAEAADREEVVVAKLDLSRLREFRTAHPRDWNRKLYQTYFPAAYTAFRNRVTQEGKRKVT